MVNMTYTFKPVWSVKTGALIGAGVGLASSLYFLYEYPEQIDALDGVVAAAYLTGFGAGMCATVATIDTYVLTPGSNYISNKCSQWLKKHLDDQE